MYTRYRRVPTFSAGTIRRFHNDAAAMKKLAGRDYEDLLQVRSRRSIEVTSLWSLTSVLSRLLKACSSTMQIILPSPIFYLSFATGTHLQNFVYIQIQPSNCYPPQQATWGGHYVILQTKSAPSTQPRNCLKRQKQDHNVNRRQLENKRRHNLGHPTPNYSIWQLTSYTHSVIM